MKNLSKSIAITTLFASAMITISYAEADLDAGEEIYKAKCSVCHTSGVAGAPKLDDPANWEPRLAQGMETVVDHAINGLNAMPPKGGHPDLTDEEIQNAVAYMVDQVESAE